MQPFKCWVGRARCSDISSQQCCWNGWRSYMCSLAQLATVNRINVWYEFVRVCICLRVVVWERAIFRDNKAVSEWVLKHWPSPSGQHQTPVVSSFSNHPYLSCSLISLTQYLNICGNNVSWRRSVFSQSYFF